MRQKTPNEIFLLSSQIVVPRVSNSRVICKLEPELKKVNLHFCLLDDDNSKWLGNMFIVRILLWTSTLKICILVVSMHFNQNACWHLTCMLRVPLLSKCTPTCMLTSTCISKWWWSKWAFLKQYIVNCTCLTLQNIRFPQ